MASRLARRGQRARRYGAVAAALAVAIGIVATRPSSQEPASPAAPAGRPPADAIRGGEQVARRICASCHGFPEPDVLPRSAWRPEIEKMALIADGRDTPEWGGPRAPVALSDEYRAALAYYEARAADALPVPDPWPAPEVAARFERRSLGFADALTNEPAVANVRVADLDGDSRPEILACDMRQGAVMAGRAGEPALRLLAAVPHPSHVTVADVDEDGRRELLVGDLGEFFLGDHEKGAAVWLRPGPGGAWAPFAIGGFPRVADVASADVDGDGRTDLLVAGFGWRKTGGTTLLLNRTGDPATPSFERVVIDSRPGPIHTIPTDLDRDGRMDVLVLIAQEHEAVIAFLGDGKGGFRERVLYAAPHPNWGFTGLALVDLDGDGDEDVLATNGDMFDDDILKPYHSIQWIENRGGMRFEARTLARLPGVHRAVAADLDGDGDLDVAAAAFTAGAGADVRLPSLVWLEQTRRGTFEKRTIEVGNTTHATLDAGDVDADGDIDLVTGTFQLQGTSERWVDVWVNRGAQR